MRNRVNLGIRRGFQEVVAASLSQDNHKILRFMPDNHMRVVLALVFPPTYFRICFSIGNQIGNPAQSLSNSINLGSADQLWQ